MRVTVTGATGLIGTRVVAALQERGDEVTVLSRRPEHAHRLLGVDAVGWNPPPEPAPAQGLAARDGVIHLAGEPIAQRCPRRASNAPLQPRARYGTIVEGLAQVGSFPPAADLVAEEAEVARHYVFRQRPRRPCRRREPSPHAGACSITKRPSGTYLERRVVEVAAVTALKPGRWM